MKRTRFTEEQITGVLKVAEAGAKTGDLARRLRELESENFRWPLCCPARQSALSRFDSEILRFQGFGATRGPHELLRLKYLGER